MVGDAYATGPIIVDRAAAQREVAATFNGYSGIVIVEDVVILQTTVGIAVGQDAAFRTIVYTVAAQAWIGAVVDADTGATTARDVASLKLQTSLSDVHPIYFARCSRLGTVSVGKVINRIAEHTSDIEDIPGLTEGEQKYAESFNLKEILETVLTGELAKVSGVSPTTLKGIKRGEAKPNMATVRKILKGIEKTKTLRAHNIDPNEVGGSLNAADADIAEAHHLLLVAKEELTWGELGEVTGILVDTLRSFARTGRTKKRNAEIIREELPIIGMGVNEFDPIREKLIRSRLPITVLRDLLGVEPRALKEILECAHSPRPLTANRIKERLPAIDAYLDDLETIRVTLNKRLSKYSQRELSRITDIPQRMISDLRNGKMPRKKTLMEIKNKLRAGECV
jgi:transcriptional regulator with XRE-family HTH domain